MSVERDAITSMCTNAYKHLASVALEASLSLGWGPREGVAYHPFNHTREHGLWEFGTVCRVNVQFKSLKDSANYYCTFKFENKLVDIRAYKKNTKTETNFYKVTLPIECVTFAKSVRDVDTIVGQQLGFRGKVIRYQVTVHDLPDNDLSRLKDWVMLTPQTATKPSDQIVRKRGTAILETPEGVLVVAGKKGKFLLPGGGAEKGESRMNAAIRELKEETGLEAKSCKYLFSYDEPIYRKIRNLHKVFLIESDGRARHVSSESRHIDYWKPGVNFVNVSPTTKHIIERYYREFNS